MEKKRCYRCNKEKVLMLFMKDNSVYQTKTSKGRCLSCRKCSCKLALEHGGVMKRIEGKFAFVKLSKTQIIKYFLR